MLLGGPNILKARKSDTVANIERSYFERVYTNLPPHKTVGITGLFWYYDNELRNSAVSFGLLRVEGSVDVFFPSVIPSIDFNGKNSELSLYSLENNRFKFATRHSNLTLTLKVYSAVTKDSSEQSFGFRELTIHLSNFSAIDWTMICDKFKGGSDLSSGTCSCPLNQAPAQDKVCQNCAENCEICFGPKSSQCLSCAPGTHWDGKECNKCHPNCHTCIGLNEHNCRVCSFGVFKYENNSCLETCEWPFHKVEGLNQKYCAKACKPDEYEWTYNSSCLAKCDLPLIKSTREDGILTCKTPCSNFQGFLYVNGSCISTCPTPLVAEFHGTVKFCQNPCKSASDYLYANRSCLKECLSPLKMRSEPGTNYCENPCHPTSLYLYNNGSCLSSCHFPLKTRVEFGVKYCLLPCNSKSEYILNDGSCSKECPSPMIKRTEASMGTYCLNPCQSEGHFVYRNGSCLEVCPSPFEARIENSIKYCMSPCQPDQYYFYQNRSCLENCPEPLKITSEAGISLCQNPCLGQSSSFLYDDQSCYESCPSPLVSIIAEGGVNYCKSPCSKGVQFLDVDGNCRESCEYPFEVTQKGSYNFCMIGMNKAQSTQVDSIKHIVKTSLTISGLGGLLSCFILPGDPTSVLVMPLLKMFYGIKNMNIFFPTQMEVLFDEQHHIFGERILIETETSVRFTDNFKNELLFLGVLAIIAFLLTFLKSFTRLQSLAIKALLALKWNISIPIFCSFYNEIVLYSSFEFRNMDLTHASSIFSFIICLAFGILAIFTLIKILQISLKGTTKNKDFEDEKKSWRFLFEIYKPEQVFVFIHMVRVLVFSIIISYLKSYPRIQGFVILSISLVMVSNFFWKSPIENKLCYLQHMLLEALLVVYNLLVFTLSILDVFGEKASEFRVIIGGIMTVEALGAPIITALLISFKVIRWCFYFFQKGNKNDGFIQMSRINSSEQDIVDVKGNLGIFGIFFINIL